MNEGKGWPRRPEPGRRGLLRLRLGDLRQRRLDHRQRRVAGGPFKPPAQWCDALASHHRVDGQRDRAGLVELGVAADV